MTKEEASGGGGSKAKPRLHPSLRSPSLISWRRLARCAEALGLQLGLGVWVEAATATSLVPVQDPAALAVAALARLAQCELMAAVLVEEFLQTKEVGQNDAMLPVVVMFLCCGTELPAEEKPPLEIDLCAMESMVLLWLCDSN
eukprot:g47671.t1